MEVFLFHLCIACFLCNNLIFLFSHWCANRIHLQLQQSCSASVCISACYRNISFPFGMNTVFLSLNLTTSNAAVESNSSQSSDTVSLYVSFICTPFLSFSSVLLCMFSESCWHQLSCPAQQSISPRCPVLLFNSLIQWSLRYALCFIGTCT